MRAAHQPTLRPQDVVVALALHLHDGADWTYASIAQALALSAGEVHKATRRLADARLFSPARRAVAKGPLAEFVEHGVRFAFPAVRLGRAVGLPSAHSAPVLRAVLRAPDADPCVWPDVDGAVEGQGLVPLYPGVVAAARQNPQLYDLLALTDALRIGGARERRAAGQLLRQRLEAG